MADRQELRETFDSIAANYHAARPSYPSRLFDSLESLTGIEAPSDVLEIGCATGVATIPMARRGHRMSCVELGPELAAQARANTASLGHVAIVNASFDTWEPPAWRSFDLVLAASAWHWLDPATKYQRAHDHLRPRGWLAFWSATHVAPENGDPFFADIQDVYDEIGEALPDGHVFPRPGELPDLSEEIVATGLFENVIAKQFDWEITYDAEAYIALLETFSGHIAMEQWKRDRLYSEIRHRLAERPDGRLHRHFGAVLHVAERAPWPPSPVEGSGCSSRISSGP